MMRMLLMILLLLCAGPAYAAAGLVVHGDSTGKGDGAQRRWTARLLEVLGEERSVDNHSRSRNGIDRIVNGMLEAPVPEGSVVIIYDRRNAGETSEAYIERLQQGVAALGTDRFLILPQVPVSGGGEDRLTLAVLMDINERLHAAFPDNIFDAATEARFLAALSGDETRSDRIHRNDAGQQIEAEFIGAWLSERGW